MLDEKGFDNWAGDYDESVKRSQSRCSYPFAGYGEVLEMVYRRFVSAAVPKPRSRIFFPRPSFTRLYTISSTSPYPAKG